MPWMQRIRLRVLAIVGAIAFAAFGAIAWMALPALPVVGVAIITVAAAVNTMTSRLADPVCLSCGTTIAADAQTGVYGRICGNCGAINQQPVPGILAKVAERASSEKKA